jgi:serine protease Do
LKPRRKRVLALVGGASALALAAVAFTTASPIAATSATSTEAYDRGYADLVETFMPAVVNVRVEGKPVAATAIDGPTQELPPEMREFFERFFGSPDNFRGPMPNPREPRMMQGAGSGFIISEDGKIVTNAHVVDQAETITVTLNDGTELDAKLIGLDTKTDLALLKVEHDKSLPAVKFAHSGDVRVGDKVLAVGSPFGLGGTVTSGIISATGREIGAGPYDNFLQIDAAINRGNSGGPAFNLDGEVIGVNTLIYSPSGGSVGIGFAIAADVAQQVIADLSDDGQIDRGWLGVHIQDLDDDLAQALNRDTTEGVLVSKVAEGSPAAEYGLQEGDIIVSFNGQDITRSRDLTRVVADTKSGTEVDIQVWRDGDNQDLAVKIGRLDLEPMEVSAADTDNEGPRLGLQLAPVSGEDGEFQAGALVAGVEPGSPASEKGLRAGDVIVEIDGHDIASPKEAVEAVRKVHDNGKDVVLMRIERDDAALFKAVPFQRS